ncbi:MAG: GDP-mannose 4,6-dehydratase, partial [Rickettsiales bacterium]|nr:GDP-mannose 4,6-dehydratase [Rickettsiales bacterium]
NPYGSNQKFNCKQGLIQAFVNRMTHGEPLEIWGDGSVVRDYVHIDDVTDALVASLKNTNPEPIFNIGSGVGHSINDIIHIFEELMGQSIDRRYLDGRAADVPVNILDISRAAKQLNWKPQISLKQGIARILEKHPNLIKEYV